MAYIMMVDDDMDYSAVVAAILRDVGHEIIIEPDTQKAEKMMHKRIPDLLILDVMFPENITAGFEFARRTRHYNEKLKDVPILMLSAVNDMFPLGFSSNDINEYWLPVEDFLEKTGDLDIILEKVSQMLSTEEYKNEYAENKSSI